MSAPRSQTAPAGATPPAGFGREDQLAHLLERSRAGDAVAIVAPRGMGATSLANQIARSHEEEGRAVWHITALEATAAIPFGSLAPILPLEQRIDADLDGLRAVRQAVEQVVSDQGGIIVIDDAHHTDDMSVAVLVQLAPHRLLPILTAHADADLGRIAPLLRLPAAARVDLAPLPDDVIARVIADALGGPVSGPPLRTIQHLSAGAPALATALARAAQLDGTLVRYRGSWHQVAPFHLTPAVLGEVDAELERLEPPEREALEHLGLTEPVEQVLLDELVGPDAVRSLEARGMLDVRLDGHRREVWCTRPIITAAIRQTMTTTTRATRARSLADALARTGTRREPDLAVLGGLRLDAGEALDRVEALSAARRALSTSRIELALRLARAASLSNPGDVEAGALFAELLALVGRSREAERVLSLLRPDSDDDLALWAMTRASTLFFSLEDVDEATVVLRDAQHRLAESPWGAELVGLGAVFELFLGRAAEALEVARPYLDGSPGRHLVEAITAASPALVVMGRPEEARDLAARGYEERVALGDQQMLSNAGMHVVARALASGEAGRFDEATDLCRLVHAEATRQGSGDGQMWASLIEGRALLTQGRLIDAARSFDEAGALATGLDRTPQQRWARAGVLLAAAQQGDRDAVDVATSALADCPPTRMRVMSSEITRALAWGAVAAGDLRGGAARLVQAADEAAAIGETGMEVIALHDLVRLGETGTTDRLLARCDLVEGALASARRLHAMALAAADVDDLEAVSDTFGALGAWLFAAEALAQAARCARQADLTRRAMVLQDRSADIASRCQRADTPELASTAGLHELTPRELEVSRRAARGLRSKEIAAELAISVRTVDNLLQRSYGKLGIRSRADLREVFGP